MKRTYSEYLWTLELETMRQCVFGAPLSQTQQRIYLVSPTLGRQLTWDEAGKEAALLANRLQIEALARAGNCFHVFFTGIGMHDWLAACHTPMIDDQREIIRRFLACTDTKIPGLTLHPFMLHFPSPAPAYLCCWADGAFDFAGKDVDRKPLFILRGRKHHTCFACAGVETDDPEIIQVRNVVISGLAYMQCFPEMVTDGIPADLQHPNHYRGQTCRAVAMSPRLIERDGPSPHYRSGHFRLLQSERYTHKRGQVVFVRGCFVKGKAVTVDGFEEKETAAPCPPPS